MSVITHELWNSTVAGLTSNDQVLMRDCQMKGRAIAASLHASIGDMLLLPGHSLRITGALCRRVQMSPHQL